MIKPTDAELAVLTVLWEQGACTVREVHEVLQQTQRTSYTTTLKIMQNMARKELVHRDERARSHVYTAAAEASATRRGLVADLMERAFAGSTAKLMLAALGGRASREEIDEIRDLLESLEE